jgi:hypothetical protein
MTRDLPADLATALATQGTVEGVIALMGEFQFESGTVAMWTGVGPLIYNGVTFEGGGNLVSVSPYEETQELQAKGMVFTLSGVPTNLISIAESENYQSRPMRLYLALVDITSSIELEDGTGVLLLEGGGKIKLESRVNSIYRLFSGFMDTMTIQDDANGATIQLSCESVASILKRSKTRRYTAEDQKSRFPDDLGLDFIAQLQDKELIW